MNQRRTASKFVAYVILFIYLIGSNDQIIKQVHCGASRKFLTGFLLAILLGKSG